MEKIIIDHRMKNNDRRSWMRKSKFPVQDSNGVLVHEDRRILAERRGYRIEVISLEEIEPVEIEPVGIEAGDVA